MKDNHCADNDVKTASESRCYARAEGRENSRVTSELDDNMTMCRIESFIFSVSEALNTEMFLMLKLERLEATKLKLRFLTGSELCTHSWTSGQLSQGQSL